jgi:hypothetical protein
VFFNTEQSSKMSSTFAFSWEVPPAGWPADIRDSWRAKKFNTPLPCPRGADCVYDGVCSGVHPGEEGTGLRFFPARASRVGGSEVWERACVRLIGTREQPVRFYERRRLRLSWPEWCAQEGLAEPRAEAPALRELPKPKPAAPTLPTGEEDSDIEGVVEFTQEELELAPFAVAAEASLNLAAIRAAQEQQAAAQRAAEQQRVFAQWQAWQQQLFAQQQALYQQQAAAQRHAWVQQQRQALGEQLFVDVQGALEDTVADREILGLTGPQVTAGKITGMFLEASTVEELIQLTQDPAVFRERMFEALEVLCPAPAAAAAAAQVPPVEQPGVRVEIRQNVPSAVGLPVMGACADDTIRDLLEDIRREDAGLPPIVRPPSITSYEPLAGGAVRIVKTVLPLPKEETWADAADEAAEQRATAAAKTAADRAAGWEKAGPRRGGGGGGGPDLRRQAMENARGRR